MVVIDGVDGNNVFILTGYQLSPFCDQATSTNEDKVQLVQLT